MDRIVLEVDDATGRGYQNFSPEDKERFNMIVSVMLKKTINNSASRSYKNLLDEIGMEALDNGMSPDILNALLRSDD